MALSNQQLEERLRRSRLRRPGDMATTSFTTAGMDQTARNPSYVGNIGFGGFEDAGQDGNSTAGRYTTPDASTEATNPANIAADLMKGDSKLMRAAETRGMQAANKRGLINSSIAVGEAQDAVLDEVIPLASQEAQQRFQDNSAKQGFGFDSLLSRQGYEQDRSQARDAFGYERDLQRERIEAERGEAALDRDFELTFQGREFDARYNLAGMDADIRRELMQMESDMRLRLAETENRLDSRNIATEAFLTARDQYNQRVTNIMNNPDMSAEEKVDAIRSEQDNLNTDVQAIEDLYSIDLPWTEDYQPSSAQTVSAQEARREISGFYDEIFGRDADLAGLNFYEQKVTAGEMTLADVRRALLQSREAENLGTRTGREQVGENSSINPDTARQQQQYFAVRKAYRDVLGRNSDSEGLQYWTSQINSGNVDIAGVRRALQNSPEGRGEVRYDPETRQLVPVDQGGLDQSQNPAPSGDNASQLRAAYQEILGRAPDTAGFAFWLKQLDEGNVTIDQVRENFQQTAANG